MVTYFVNPATGDAQRQRGQGSRYHSDVRKFFLQQIVLNCILVRGWDEIQYPYCKGWRAV